MRWGHVRPGRVVHRRAAPGGRDDIAPGRDRRGPANALRGTGRAGAALASVGHRPDAVVGHSMGEVAAAHVAGALTLVDAARVICTRSRLMRTTSGRGAMSVVELSVQ